MRTFKAGDKVRVKNERELWRGMYIHAGHKEPYLVVSVKPHDAPKDGKHSQLLTLVDAGGSFSALASGYWFDGSVKP